MAYRTLYRAQFVNQEVNSANENAQQIITVDIIDTESDEVINSEVTPLQTADNPLTIEVIANDEDPFDPIKSKRATINIHSTDSVGLETFSEGGDNRWNVIIYSEVETLLIGWLSIADLQEDFLPDPNILTLTATDGMGFLADEPLTDLEGNNPQNEYSILDYLVMALAKTGNSLGFVIVMNIREQDASNINDDADGSGHFVKFCYLDAKTFEADIGECEDCKTVIEKIIQDEGFYLQKNGLHFIMRVDEMQVGDLFYAFRFDAEGNFINKSQISYQKYIGVSAPMQWKDDDAIVAADRIYKQIKEIFKYESAKELLCNIDFDRGEGDASTNAPDETIDYTLDCWEFLSEGVDAGDDLDSPPIIGSLGVLRKRFEFDYEKDRYLATKTAGGFRHYFKSSGIYMQEKDKISIGFQFRFDTDLSADDIPVAHVRLVGDDGFVYDWELSPAGVSSWNQKSATDIVFNDEWLANIASLDTRDWASISATSQPVPANGTLYIRLVNSRDSSIQMDFSGLSVDYIPLINGSYGKYTGHIDTVTQPETPDKYKAVREKQVYIDTAPKKSLKGAILKRGADIILYEGGADFSTLGQFEIAGYVGNIFKSGMKIVISDTTSNNQEAKILSVSYSIIGDATIITTDGTTVTETGVDITVSLINYILAENFYNAAVFPDGVPDETYAHPYGQIRAFDVWNQFNRTMRRFEGNIDHLESGSEQPDVNHKYTLTDANPNTNNKVFQLLHYINDEHLCSWQGFFHELHDSTISKQYLGHEFKYTTSDE